MMSGNLPKISEEEQEKWDSYFDRTVAESRRKYEQEKHGNESPPE